MSGPSVLTEHRRCAFGVVAQTRKRAWRRPGLSWKESKPSWRHRARPSSSSSSTPLASRVRGWSLVPTDSWVSAWGNRKSTLLFPHAGARRSSVNDSHSSNVPGFLRLGWSLKQLPKVRGLFGNVQKTQNAKLRSSILPLFFFIASAYRVWLGEPSGSTPAPLCQVMWRVWVIWLVQMNNPI